jgi:hypothetical protein
MRSVHLAGSFLVASVAGLVACGGSAPAPGTTLNPYLGTLHVTSASAATNCVTTHVVTYAAGAVDVHVVTAAGGDCLQFVNDDTASHQPSSLPVGSCSELDASGPVLPHGTPFTTPPLVAAKTCSWQDALNPPTSGGGGGGGY